MLILASLGLNATQAQPFASRNLSLAQGLPEYYVSGLAQDKAGFIWVATRDGLARYDGRSFKIFRHRAHQPNSLAYNVIVSLQQTSDSTILLTLENGQLQIFNPVTEVFKRVFTGKSIAGRFGFIISPDESQLWGRNDSTLTVLDRRINQMRTYSIAHFNPSGSAPISSPFLRTAHQRLYAAVSGGLVEIDTRTRQHRRWACPQIGEYFQKSTYYQVQMAERLTGELIIGGVHQLVAFHPKTHRYRTIPIPAALRTQVSVVHTAPDGNIYFCYGMTLYRLAPDDRITPLWTAPRTDYMNYFRSILVDRSGVCWLGTNGDGIQQIDLRSLPFKSYPYKKDFAYDLLTVEMGLPAPTWTSIDLCYRLRFGGSAPYVTGWIGNSYKVLKGDRQLSTLEPILSIPQKHPGASGGGIRTLPNGHILFYDNDFGLIQADSRGHVLRRDPLWIESVTDLQPIGDHVYVSTEDQGLYAYNLRRKRSLYQLHHDPADPHSLPANNVQCLARDPADPSVLWIGMLGEGLCRLDTRTLRYRILTEKDGLPNASIQALLPDRNGNLWFSTLKGISKLSPKTGQIRHFTTDDGLQDIEYKLRHASQLPDGRLAFGGLSGMTIFDPSAIDDDLYEVPTRLVALKINNTPVEADQPNSPLTVSLTRTHTLELDHTQNFITLDFAGLQFNKPGKIQYRYQLVGVDQKWVYAGTTNSANYSQLAPGTYEFWANATNTSGRWSPMIKTLRIVITPPWWASWWAYLGYGLLIIAAVWQFTQVRIKRVGAQREAEQRLAMNEMKTQFFTNITHELRTPLTLILSPVEALQVNLNDTPYSKSLALIQRNARQLLSLINQLMDLARLEAQFMTVDVSRGQLADFVNQLVQPFAQQAANHQITFRYQPDVEGNYWFDADKLERIITNLLANALKFTQAGGHIGLSLRESDGMMLTVTDTGIGIAADQLPYIFDRFFRVQNTPIRNYVANDTLNGVPPGWAPHSEGSGIGLALVKELVTLQGGLITVESQPGQGTSFCVTLPYRRADEATTPPPQETADTVFNPVPSSQESPNVLLVEDNLELAGFIADCLPSQYTIDRASNGHAGLQLAFQLIPDLIISDVMMPGMDGYTLVQHLKEDVRTNHIPVILLTAKASFGHRLEGLTKGADDYLTKPFHVGELRLRVENLLSRQRRLQERLSTLLRQPQVTPTPETNPSIADQNPFLERTYSLLDQHLSNSTLSVEELATYLHLDRSSLHRKVKALTGMSASELMRTYRLKQASKLLHQGLTSSEVAYQTGFDSPAYFTKCFREQYGRTPTEFARDASKRNV